MERGRPGDALKRTSYVIGPLPSDQGTLLYSPERSTRAAR